MNQQLLKTLFAWSGQAGNPLPEVTYNAGAGCIKFLWGRHSSRRLAVVFFDDIDCVRAIKAPDCKVEIETPAQLIELLNWVKAVSSTDERVAGD